MRLRLRYSLRRLLVAVTLAGTVGYWAVLPMLNAQRFASAINRGDYAAAEQLCVNTEHTFPGKWKEHAYFQPRASVGSWSWRNLVQGEHGVYISIHYGDGNGIGSCGQYCVATRSGIVETMCAP